MIVIPVAAIRTSVARSTVESRLRSARAVDPQHAIALEPLDAAESAGLDEAIGLGRVVRLPNGRCFLNPAAIRKPYEGVGYGFLLGLLALGSVAASIAALVMVATH